MERHIERFLNRLSIVLATISTVSLIHLYFTHSTATCNPRRSSLTHHHLRTHTHTHTLSRTPFPFSSCDPSLPSRDLLPPDKRFKKLAASSSFRKRAASFSSLFLSLRSLRLLSNHSRVLCAPSGAGHDAFALQNSGVSDVTAVDLVDFPPFVRRSDLHNLPFFDRVFDLVFSAGFDSALFPRRFAEEMERTVVDGGGLAVVVEKEEEDHDHDDDDHRGMMKELFQRSTVLETRDVSLDGIVMRFIVMSKNGNSSSSATSSSNE